MARFSTPTVASHLVYGWPPVESFRKPSALHCNVPNDASAYAVKSTMILLRIVLEAVHPDAVAERIRLLLPVCASFWHTNTPLGPSHDSTIWFSSLRWFRQTLGTTPLVATRM